MGSTGLPRFFAMTDNADDLYRDIILEHARHPRNAESVANPHKRARASNPLCGDELEVTLALDGETIAAIGVQVRGCAIAQASTSLMSEVVLGKTLHESDALGRAFKEMMEGTRMELPAALDSLKPLEAVRQHSSRITCTLLAWQALGKAARQEG